jgi:hypothetical protein
LGFAVVARAVCRIDMHNAKIERVIETSIPLFSGFRTKRLPPPNASLETCVPVRVRFGIPVAENQWGRPLRLPRLSQESHAWKCW